MSPYEKRAWAEIEKWSNSRLTARTRHVVPPGARRRLTSAGKTAKKRVDSLPGAGEFEAIFVKALGGLTDLGARAAMASIRDGSIAEAYRKSGHPVEDITDIRKLELQAVDKVKPKLGLAYTAGAAFEGAAAGLVVSGGEIIAAGGSLLGAGAGAAPGVGTVVAAMATDAATVLVAANRAVAHIAAYYGYDIDHPDERLFALTVLSMGTATEAGKAAAYIEINKLVQALARRATWDQLRQNVVTNVVEKVFTRLGFRITQRKLGQAVPFIGIALGAGMNARLLASVTEDADYVYRERFLRERYGLTSQVPTELTVEQAEDADVVDIVEIVDEEIDADEGDSEPDA